MEASSVTIISLASGLLAITLSRFFLRIFSPFQEVMMTEISMRYFTPMAVINGIGVIAFSCWKLRI